MDIDKSRYRRYLDGDTKAFDEIMDEHFDALIFFIDRYVHDIYAAEDIAIETFSELIINSRRYNFSVSLKTYIFMIGRCRALNHLKKRSRSRAVSLTDINADISDRQSIEEKLIQKEELKHLSEALDILPEDMRAVIHLVYFEDMSYEQAARILKKNKKQIDNLLYRAKGLLRTTMTKEVNIK
ncbi:MAG: RNA polymerase sigma factor [Clostridia bacterium]|nr:RNA polymerase sigma factor [Clostridia bacterium]